MVGERVVGNPNLWKHIYSHENQLLTFCVRAAHDMLFDLVVVSVFMPHPRRDGELWSQSAGTEHILLLHVQRDGSTIERDDSVLRVLSRWRQLQNVNRIRRCSCNKFSITVKRDCLSTDPHPQTEYTDILFHSCDLDFDQKTLTNEQNLDILKTYLQTKNKLSRSRLSKVKA